MSAISGKDFETMTNQEKKAKLEKKRAKQSRKDHLMTGLGYGTCVGFIGLAIGAVTGKALWGAVALAVCMAVGALTGYLLGKKQKTT
jgi:predicted small integral membrane protein